MAGVSRPREYTLIVRNDAGGVIRRISLLQKNIFGHNPSGLGVEFDRSYFSSNGSHYNYDTEVVKAQMTFNVVVGAVSNPYGAFHDFVNSLDGNLELEYKADGLPHTFVRDVAIAKIANDEVDLNGVLNAELVLDCLTPWFNWVRVNHTPTGNNGAMYMINNDSMYLNNKKLSPIYVEIRNWADIPIVNPHYALRGGNNFQDLLGEFRWIGQIPVNHTLIVSTSVGTGRVVLRNDANNIEVDVSSQLDIRFMNFLFAPKGWSRIDTHSVGLTAQGNMLVWYKHERLVV